jgi:hypothetical protein
VRAVLYLSTPDNPVIGIFYKRLFGARKGKKVALVVRMRKLLARLNAMVKYQQALRVPRKSEPKAAALA